MEAERMVRNSATNSVIDTAKEVVGKLTKTEGFSNRELRDLEDKGYVGVNKKIMIKLSHSAGTIVNMVARYEKGHIYAVPASYKVNLEVFDVVEVEGVKIEQKRPMRPHEARDLLLRNDPSGVISLLKTRDIIYEDVKMLMDVEQANQKRQAILNYLHDIPEPKDIGDNITYAGMYRTKLARVGKSPFKDEYGKNTMLSQIEIDNIVKQYTDEELLTEALRSGETLPFNEKVVKILHWFYRTDNSVHEV